MSMTSTKLSSRIYSFADTDEDDYDDTEETRIELSNLIFLPFHPNFQALVLVVVIHKCILGPIQSVYPIVLCWDTMDRNIYLSCIKIFYWHCCDIIYVIDMLLHIVHRQVTDKAMRREYLPKSAFLIVLDIFAVIPFFGLTTEICDVPALWPNILAFSEFLVIYRVVEYYSLLTNHSFSNLLVGSLILLVCIMNCINCFWLLLTKHGLCEGCEDKVYDWRQYLSYKFNQSSEEFSTYIYGMAFISSYVFNEILDDVVPSSIAEYISTAILVILGYLLMTCFFLPKLFAELVLRLRRISTAYPIIQRLVAETKRRNPSPKAHIKVANFYSTMWSKRRGIIRIPDILQELPRYLRVDIEQDLAWPLFYHSPTLRRLSNPFKRCLCETAIWNFKLPGEKFFTGPHTYTNLYYLKSGIVQILSGDEGITPIISVTSGTIFGDISFLVPPLKRKITMKCLTYCEVIYLTRKDCIKTLYKYAEDRRRVLQLANERMTHAKTLYSCKQNVRGLDRAEDEGIAWVKRRWWEISDVLASWQKKTGKNHAPCELPREETIYHCAKYIGQLVLCNETELQTKSMFANIKFPWILTPQSAFIKAWYRIVWLTVFLVLILYPPNLTKEIIPTWFILFQVWTDFVYVFDICISLLTVVNETESATSNFASVMFARCKTLKFILDLIATVWIELIAIAIGQPQYYKICQFNRIIKIYMLYTGYISWDVMKNPMITVYFRLIMIHFCFAYLFSYMILALTNLVPNIHQSKRFYFDAMYCGPRNLEDIDKCYSEGKSSIYVAISWIIAYFYSTEYPRTLTDTYILLIFTPFVFYLKAYGLALFIAAIYLKFRDITNYQNFVSNLKSYYKNYKIHDNLLKRLDNYLTCHWKYYQGADIMQTYLLKNEPYDIYWKVQGEVAEKIIGESRAFLGADPALIRDLAYVAKFLILPKNSTLFLFGVQCQNVTWVARGLIKSEYHNDDGELIKMFLEPGQMLSASSVFLGKKSFRTYITCTDSEILFIKRSDFFKIIKQCPNECSNIDRCVSEFSPIFQDMFQKYTKKHRDYQRKLRDRIFHSRRSTVVLRSKSIFKAIEFRPAMISPIQHDFWSEPESEFMHIWLPFRMIIAIVSMLNASIQGGSGVVWRRNLIVIGAFCDCITWMDIILKMFLAYYNEHGLLIFNKRMCVIHYLLRGFLLDMIGALPWYEVIQLMLAKGMLESKCLLINLFSKYAHLYIVVGYFNHLSDAPSVNSTYLTIIKWQVIIILLSFGVSHYLMSYCFLYEFDENYNLTRITHTNDTCWLPRRTRLQNPPTTTELHYAYAESLNLVQNTLTALNLENFKITYGDLGVGIVYLLMLSIFWYALGYSVTLLVLNSRSNRLFQHGVSQLSKFLKAERVDKEMIERGTSHFTYWWMRTKGINIHHLTNERIGVVFRQDLTYFFYKTTFLALDTILKGGENQGRELASASFHCFMLPGQEIVREMDLLAWVFVVHRGRVIISKNGVTIAVLGKGSIFGHLVGTEVCPVRISARTEAHADLLQIGIKHFQDIINDETREIIASTSSSKLDYMSTRRYVLENPYDSLQYILRGSKSIQLPWMKAPVEASHNSWYCRWLYMAWMMEPFLTAFIWFTLKLYIEQQRGLLELYWLLVPLDCIAFINFVFEFFVVELVVVNKKCVNRVMGYRRLQRVGIYFDFLVLVLPAVTIFTDNTDALQLFRLLRLRNLYKFYIHFCCNFKSKVAPTMLKFAIVYLYLHINTCSWIYVTCRNQRNPFNIEGYPDTVNETIDYSKWSLPKYRIGGCARLFWSYIPDVGHPGLLVAKNWMYDYILVMCFILFYYTRTSVQVLLLITTEQIYFKLLTTFIMHLSYIWIMSEIINFVYTRFRELYQYDFNVDNLLMYLKYSGLSPALLETVRKYTQQLWQRQKGNWMPELVQQAPQCLREDLMGALYMHHLESPPIFRELPLYFKRQLVSRFKRTVVFPGKCIVQEGDSLPQIFFIHEGEVEKWYVDKSGESRMMSLLTTNGFFGQVPGLYPNVTFQFTYLTRTVADLITLNHWDWQDLLNGYPDVKHELYDCAKLLKMAVDRDMHKQKERLHMPP